MIKLGKGAVFLPPFLHNHSVYKVVGKLKGIHVNINGIYLYGRYGANSDTWWRYTWGPSFLIHLFLVAFRKKKARIFIHLKFQGLLLFVWLAYYHSNIIIPIFHPYWVLKNNAHLFSSVNHSNTSTLTSTQPDS